jgi:glycogen debranching enzyme
MSLSIAVTAAGPTPGTFNIEAATSLQDERTRALKHGDTFLVVTPTGDTQSGTGGADGLYHRDTRYLSQMQLFLAGARPILLSSTLRDDNAALTCDLSNPDLREGENIVLPHDRLHVRRTKFLWQGTCFERLSLRNFSDQTVELPLELWFDADFSDLFEIRGRRRIRRGHRHPPEIGPGAVTLAYTGLDNVRRTTRLRFDPAPARLDGNRALFLLRLPPQGREVIYVEVRCDAPTPPRRARDTFLLSLLDARRAVHRSTGRAASVDTSNEIFNEAVHRSIADLTMLVTETEHGAYPYAGIPWFSAAFGRDALITALQVLWLDPTIARGVLLYLAANQATANDPAADAEPGKILHEVRHGEMAALGEVPFRRYYGSVDSTPLFIMLAGAYLERTEDLETLALLWPHIEAALGWIDSHGDRDGDGFVEYFRKTKEGLANQGWKDSHDSVFHADGRAAEGPIALVEVQAYVIAARQAAAAIALALGHRDRAAELAAQAATLAEQLERDFWSDELGGYALALDGEKRPCLVRSSNAGHVLLTGTTPLPRAERVAARLMGSEFFSGWGIRTLSTEAPRFNPMSYHNGSVWPHDNSLIAMGFARYGFRREAARILEGLFDACAYIDLRRLPELFCGFVRRRGQGPTFYPVACTPQAWAATAPLSLLQSCLGLSFDPGSRSVIFDQPTLPRFLDRLILRRLAIGDAWIDVMLRRRGEEVAMSVLGRSGDIRAVMTS